MRISIEKQEDGKYVIETTNLDGTIDRKDFRIHGREEVALGDLIQQFSSGLEPYRRMADEQKAEKEKRWADRMEAVDVAYRTEEARKCFR